MRWASLVVRRRPDRGAGKAQRRRLNRGGDRQADSALYALVLAWLRGDASTRGYIQRRVGEGKTRREAIRCLKRYIAREIYRLITEPRSHPGILSSAA
jgi:transposase